MQNARVLDWDDLRHFLAVARAGSTLGAARLLGVNQTTVARRVASLEAALGGTALCERRQAGYRLTEAGQRVVEHAERMEAEAAALAQLLAAEGRRAAGTVRATTSEILANLIVVPFLQDFRRQHPMIRVELIVEDRRLDIARGEADVALRAGWRPLEPGGGLVGRRLCDTGWSVYCSRGYADRHGGAPGTPEALAGHQVIGGEGALAQLESLRWLEATAAGAEVACRSSSLPNLLAVAKAGLGLTALPCFLGDAEPDLVRCLPPVEALKGSLWLVTREELRGAPHIRAFLDALAAHIRPLRPWLSGCP
jgi:DNA-binding transcriptional LysR family regulator